MKFIPVIITCPGREAMLEQTLASWRASHFNGWELRLPTGGIAAFPLIQLDMNQHERRQERQEHNSLSALKLALEVDPSADFLLFMEDDIILNRHLRHNLENWKPLVEAFKRRRVAHGADCPYFFASLYDCTIRELEAYPDEHYFIADPDAVYGSQCYVVSTNLVEYMVLHWWEVPGMQDIKMSRLAARLCPLHYHMPSLVQHVGFKSAWTSDARFHQTRSFEGEFKA